MFLFFCNRWNIVLSYRGRYSAVFKMRVEFLFFFLLIVHWSYFKIQIHLTASCLYFSTENHTKDKMALISYGEAISQPYNPPNSLTKTSMLYQSYPIEVLLILFHVKPIQLHNICVTYAICRNATSIQHIKIKAVSLHFVINTICGLFSTQHFFAGSMHYSKKSFFLVVLYIFVYKK